MPRRSAGGSPKRRWTSSRSRDHATKGLEAEITAEATKIQETRYRRHGTIKVVNRRRASEAFAPMNGWGQQQTCVDTFITKEELRMQHKTGVLAILFCVAGITLSAQVGPPIS